MAKKQRNKLISQEEIKGSALEASASEKEPKIQFDGWYALRSSVIPAIHKKEILKADFKGRKVPMEATVAEFDEALKKYGIELE